MIGTVKHIHLAELIQDEMKERGWTITDLVAHMGPHFTERDWQVCQCSWEMFLEVREQNVVLGDHMAGQLSIAFDVDAQFFLNFHEAWRSSVQQAVQA